MWTKVVSTVKKNKWMQFGLTLIAGVAIGAVFYPTKRIEERVKLEYEQKMAVQREEHSKVQKELSDKYQKVTEEKHSMEIETTKKIATLNLQIRDLNSKKKETFYKIVKPDGTIEIRKFKETEVNETTTVVTQIQEEFTQKIKEVGERYEAVHRERVTKIKEEFDKKESEYKSTIARMEHEKITDINPKRYGLEAGYLNTKSYYGHVTADVFGPVYLGLHTQTNLQSDYAVGGGIGIRF